MRKTVAGVAMFVMAGCSRSAPSPCTSETGRTLTVLGEAVVRVEPDQVTFSVGVEARAERVREAFDANARKLAAVLAALKRRGIDADAIKVSGLDVTSVVSESGRPAGFRVADLVTVRRVDSESAISLVEEAVGAGATQIGGLKFFTSDPKASERKGMELAFEDARVKAEALATASGRELGGVICASERASEVREASAELASLGYVDTSSVEPGSEERSFAVSIVFELK